MNYPNGGFATVTDRDSNSDWFSGGFCRRAVSRVDKNRNKGRDITACKDGDVCQNPKVIFPI